MNKTVKTSSQPKKTLSSGSPYVVGKGLKTASKPTNMLMKKTMMKMKKK